MWGEERESRTTMERCWGRQCSIRGEKRRKERISKSVKGKKEESFSRNKEEGEIGRVISKTEEGGGEYSDYRDLGEKREY